MIKIAITATFRTSYVFLYRSLSLGDSLGDRSLLIVFIAFIKKIVVGHLGDGMFSIAEKKRF
jgi:hypothetical protein